MSGYTLFNTDARVYKIINDTIAAPGIGDRILFGTDYYMTLQEAPEQKLWEDCRKRLSETDFDKIATANTNSYLASNFFPDPGNTRFMS